MPKVSTTMTDQELIDLVASPAEGKNALKNKVHRCKYGKRRHDADASAVARLCA
jgi:hypothetical protein